jgi:hypothetical protein
VKTRVIVPLALAAGCWLPAGTYAGPKTGKSQPATPPAAAPFSAGDQALAEACAQQVMTGTPIEGCAFDINCTGGVVELTGTVASKGHATEIEKRVKSVKGVRGVKNALVVSARPAMPTGIMQTAAAAPGEPLSPPAARPAPLPGTMLPPGATMLPPGVAGPVSGEPTPVAGGGPATYDLNPPKMPSYAWPTYAPYNNYSRVAYPSLYPYSAWPFIGPFYPFPKVPLGWRKVTLEWEDGHWFYSKNAAPHDYWRVRYW